MNGERTRMRKCNEGSDCMDGVRILHFKEHGESGV